MNVELRIRLQQELMNTEKLVVVLKGMSKVINDGNELKSTIVLLADVLEYKMSFYQELLEDAQKEGKRND